MNLTYLEFMNLNMPSWWHFLDRWRYCTSRGYLYIVTYKAVDIYLLSMVIVPALFLVLQHMTKRRRWKIVFRLLMIVSPIVAGVWRTWPIYQYVHTYLIPPSRLAKCVECANASVCTGVLCSLFFIVVLAADRLENRLRPKK